MICRPSVFRDFCPIFVAMITILEPAQVIDYTAVLPRGHHV
jgi:hypothetical protein